MATITVDNTPEVCDFCSQLKGEQGRYLVHNHDKTEAICNFCIMVLHEQVMQIEFLRYAPEGTKQ